MKGRQLSEAVLKLEYHTHMYSLVYPEFPAILLLDHRAAFPSVFHDFLFFVLESMEVPQQLVYAIKLLYANNKAFIKFYSLTDVCISIGRGIR